MIGRRHKQIPIENIYGDRDDNVIRGSDAYEIIWGLGGNDRLFGSGGNDQIFGGAGKDYLVDGRGNDNLIGERGADTFLIKTGVDHVSGGGGKDVVILDGEYADWHLEVDDTFSVVLMRGDQVVVTSQVELAVFDDQTVDIGILSPL